MPWLEAATALAMGPGLLVDWLDHDVAPLLVGCGVALGLCVLSPVRPILASGMLKSLTPEPALGMP